jgi:tRNA (adenine-N(1)-)-methyltransferase non-catalytic subunit
LFNVCEYWYNKNQNRIRDLRPDTLSQLLNMANIRPGGRYIVVDDASGLVVSAILERMGGNAMSRHQLNVFLTIHLHSQVMAD